MHRKKIIQEHVNETMCNDGSRKEEKSKENGCERCAHQSHSAMLHNVPK
jgi:hypothetical protein